MFQMENGMRPTAKHVAVVMTDGKSQDDVENPSKIAKEKGTVGRPIVLAKSLSRV